MSTVTISRATLERWEGLLFAAHQGIAHKSVVRDVRGEMQTTLADADTIAHSEWKCGNEFLPYHPQASHAPPDYRDGWNACFKAAMALRQPIPESMLTGPALGEAIEAARAKKGVTKKAMADHFGVEPPSIQGWVNCGTISKEKLPKLWAYFSDVVGPEHWGLSAYAAPVSRFSDADVKQIMALVHDAKNASVMIGKGCDYAAWYRKAEKATDEIEALLRAAGG
jgi:hypothetical protein